LAFVFKVKKSMSLVLFLAPVVLALLYVLSLASWSCAWSFVSTCIFCQTSESLHADV